MKIFSNSLNDQCLFSDIEDIQISKPSPGVIPATVELIKLKLCSQVKASCSPFYSNDFQIGAELQVDRTRNSPTFIEIFRKEVEDISKKRMSICEDLIEGWHIFANLSNISYQEHKKLHKLVNDSNYAPSTTRVLVGHGYLKARVSLLE